MSKILNIKEDVKLNLNNVQNGVEMQNAINSKQDKLGFTPVQQGGGTNMSQNKVYIGWDTNRSELLAQVDSTPQGAIALKKDLGTQATFTLVGNDLKITY